MIYWVAGGSAEFNWAIALLGAMVWAFAEGCGEDCKAGWASDVPTL